MLPLTATDPPLLLSLVAFQRRGDQLVRSPARLVRRFHGCVLVDHQHPRQRPPVSPLSGCPYHLPRLGLLPFSHQATDTHG